MFSHPYCRKDVREGIKYRDAASLKRAVSYESKRAFLQATRHLGRSIRQMNRKYKMADGIDKMADEIDKMAALLQLIQVQNYIKKNTFVDSTFCILFI